MYIYKKINNYDPYNDKAKKNAVSIAYKHHLRIGNPLDENNASWPID
jgi:hypothetical protein